MRLTSRDNLSRVMADIDGFAKGVRIGAAIALTATAKLAQAAEVQEMRDVFDRPTPFTLNSVFIVPATQDKLEAEVYIKDEAYKGRSAREYLLPEIEGGVRVEKRSEFILRSQGILPAGMNAVPGKAARMNQYGNMQPGQMQQILSALRVSETVLGHTSDRPRDKKRQRKGAPQYFIARRGAIHTRHLHPGIWLRDGTGVHPVLMFVRRATYSKRLDFNGVAERVADENLGRLLEIELAKTIRRRGTSA